MVVTLAGWESWLFSLRAKGMMGNPVDALPLGDKSRWLLTSWLELCPLAECLKVNDAR